MNVYDRLLLFLTRLEDKRIAYSLGHARDDAIMVTVVVPGERWEVEFLKDGTVDVERSVSTEDLCGEEALAELFVKYAGVDFEKTSPQWPS